MGIYEELKAANVPIDNHYSDLYALKTPESKTIIDKYQFKHSVTCFVNQTDGKVWYDIPFAFQPFWDKKMIKGGR